jgi:hypothetical protein
VGHYATIIQKLQKELNLEVSFFSQLGLYGIEEVEEQYDDNEKYTTQDC